jgi:hypothetical protein
MNHSCNKLYNFPEELVRIIYADIKKIHKIELHRNMLNEIKYKCLKISSHRIYKELINEINIIYYI